MLNIGDRVSIQHRCFFSCIGGLIIGNDVSIAHDVSIITSSHNYKGDGKIREHPLVLSPVIIGSNVWIGMKVMILAGSQVGSDVVIGAGSLVNKLIPNNSVAYGIPVEIKGKIHNE